MGKGKRQGYRAFSPHHHELSLSRKGFGFFPGRKSINEIIAYYDAGFFIHNSLGLKISQAIDSVGKSPAIQLAAIQGEDSGIGNAGLQHRGPEIRTWIFQVFMGRQKGGHEDYRIAMSGVEDFLGHYQVSDMDRVEAASKNRRFHNRLSSSAESNRLSSGAASSSSGRVSEPSAAILDSSSTTC